MQMERPETEKPVKVEMVYIVINFIITRFIQQLFHIVVTSWCLNIIHFFLDKV